MHWPKHLPQIHMQNYMLIKMHKTASKSQINSGDTLKMKTVVKPFQYANFIFQISCMFYTGHLGFTEGYSVDIIHVTRYRIAAPLAYWQSMPFDLLKIIMGSCLAIWSPFYIQARLQTCPLKRCIYVDNLTRHVISSRSICKSISFL